MSHEAQRAFVEEMRRTHPEFFAGRSVLEIGSRNVNGTVRDWFLRPTRYVGVDCVPGLGVDVVCLAHEYDSPEPFDVVISCEAFEHDPYLEKTLANAMRLLRQGGLFVATAAGPRRAEHGTERTTGRGNLYGPSPTYYRNVDPDWLRGVLADYLQSFEVRELGGDVQAHGVR